MRFPRSSQTTRHGQSFWRITIPLIMFGAISTTSFLAMKHAAVVSNQHVSEGGGEMSPAITDMQQCIERIPKWFKAPHADLLKEEFVVGSEGLTDKTTDHKYHYLYHHYLSSMLLRRCLEQGVEGDRKRKKTFRVLEIGLGCSFIRNEPGGSARAWNHLFKPLSGDLELDLHLMEFDKDCAEKFAIDHPNLGRIHSGDASSKDDLDRVVRESGAAQFDLIVDDGSHLNEHQIKTFEHMIQFVSEGGIYVIEDIQSSCHSWKALTGAVTTGQYTGGTKGCMETEDKSPTIFAKLMEWQKVMIQGSSPFPGVTHISLYHEAAVISKEF